MSDHPDSQTITAVRAGEVDRFRELIDRYERHVYAIAWARLGDASLAEEVVQESFIRAFRLLSWLRDPARFAGWITRITRAVAINLGLRKRRELRRRERWALDPSVAPSDSGRPDANPDPTDPLTVSPVAPDALRSALSELPASHRECLVLFYLEGRPAAQASAILGITEGAFKVRLHRARHALRGKLQRHLESSLGQLAPRRSLAPGIMASIALKAAVADPTGTGSGFLALVSAGFLKLIPFPLLFLFFPVAMVGVGFGAHAWAGRAERRNYRDFEGFRRRLYDDDRARRQARTALLVVTILAFFGSLMLFPTLLPFLPLTLIPPMAWGMAVCLRRYRLNRRLADLIYPLSTVPVVSLQLTTIVFQIPGWLTGAAWMIAYLGMVFFPFRRPLRFDYSLFLRQRFGLLEGAPMCPTSAATQPGPNRESIWAFARFAANHHLVTAYRWSPEGLLLKLHPVSTPTFDWLGSWVRHRDSTILLLADGAVQATLGSQDSLHLERLEIRPTSEPLTERQSVESSVANAFIAFSHGQPDAALAHLGHVPDAMVFAVAPSRTGYERLQRISGALGIFAAALMIVAPWLPGGRADQIRNLSAHLVPVSASLDQTRAAFATVGSESGVSSRHRWDTLLRALHEGYHLPPLPWASPEAREFIRTNWFSFTADDLEREPRRVEGLLAGWQTLKAIHLGWAESDLLRDLRRIAPQLRTAAAELSPESRSQLLSLQEVPILNQEFSALEITPLRWRLAAAKDIGLLDLFDRHSLIAQLRDHQITPDRPFPQGRNPNIDRSAWHGFFLTRGWDPIAETYDVLAILETLDALDAIDREACAQAILRLHLGAGLFLAPAPWQRPFVRRNPSGIQPQLPYIPGDARTTYAARESLRILNALDRIPDLAQWQYRVHPGNPDSAATQKTGAPAWPEIEAVLLQHNVTGR